MHQTDRFPIQWIQDFVFDGAVISCVIGGGMEQTALRTSVAMVAKKKLRSDEWFEVPELYGWTRRAALQGSGLTPEDDRYGPHQSLGYT